MRLRKSCQNKSFMLPYRVISIQYHSFSVMSQFVSTDELKQLIEKMPELLPYQVKILKEAALSSDHRHYFGKIYIAAFELLIPICRICEASDSLVDVLVKEGLIEPLVSLLLSDLNKFSKDIAGAIECLWAILQAGQGKHKEAAKNHPNLLFGLI